MVDNVHESRSLGQSRAAQTTYGQRHCALQTVPTNDLQSNLYITRLDTESKKRMLGSERWTAGMASQAVRLLERLQTLLPSSATTFQAKPNPLEHDFALKLISARNDTPLKTFIALSYCWDSSLGTISMTTSPDCAQRSFRLPTSRDMLEAVLAECQGTREGLWYDQACINQDDKVEKATCIGAMDCIYASARIVVIVLEDVALTPEEACYIVDQLAAGQWLQKDFLADDRDIHCHPLFRTFMGKLILARWFERAWCGHEMRLCQKV